MDVRYQLFLILRKRGGDLRPFTNSKQEKKIIKKKRNDKVKIPPVGKKKRNERGEFPCYYVMRYKDSKLEILVGQKAVS